MGLIENILTAYGGEARWRNATAVEAVVSSGGLVFLMKQRRPLHRIEVFAEIANPYVRFGPINKKGSHACLQGQKVQLEDAGGKILETREDPRKYFPGGRRLLRWDDLDQAYFAGYALWNYLMFPALLMRSDIRWTELSANVLEGRFPLHIPTHCETQQFRFHPTTHLLLRHDYTAEVFGNWAKAANQVLEHSAWDRIPYPSKRRVTPRSSKGQPRKWPLLVWIEVHDWRLI